MKWLLGTILLGLIVWSAVAYALIPDMSDDDRTVLVWVSGDNPARRGTIALFEEKNRDIRVLLDPANTGVEKTIVQCLGGIGPDIFNVYTWYHLRDYTKANVLLPLDEYADKYNFSPDQTYPQVLEEMTLKEWNPKTGEYERVQYTFPANVNANVIFYHKSMFDEIGEPYPTGDWTWEECLRVAKLLTVKGPDGRYKRYGIGTFETLETIELVWQFGGRIFDESYTYCTMDSPEAVEAVQFLVRMLTTDKVMPSVAERDAMGTGGGWGGALLDMFAEKQIGMIRIGRWLMIKVRQREGLKGEIGAVQLPYKREKVGIIRAMSTGINPESPNREAALRFLSFLASEDFSWQVVDSADALPPSPEVLRHADFIKDPKHPEEDFNALFDEAVKRGRNLMFPPYIQGMRVQKHLDRYLALLSEDRLTPEEMCRRFTDEVNKDIRLNLTRYESMRKDYERRTGLRFDPDNFPPAEGAR